MAEVTKKEAVRQAMLQAGEDAKLSELKAVIKQKFGYDMTTNHISTARGDLRRAEAKPATAPAKKATAPKKPAPAKKAAPAAAAPSASPKVGTTVNLALIQAARELIVKVGADQAKALIDVLSK